MNTSATTAAETEEPDVKANTFDAWRVVLDPDAYNAFKIQALVERGLDTFRYTDDDGNDYLDQEEFVTVLEEFALRAMAEPDREEIIANPWFEPTEPARLVLVSSVATMLVHDNPAWERRNYRIKLHEYLHDAFAAHVYAALHHYDDKATLQQYAGEVVFSPEDQDDRGPPPGRTVRDIVTREDKPARAYFEIPASHASTHATNVRTDDGDLANFYDNGNVYVPFWALEEALDEHLLEGRPGKSVAQYFTSTLEEYYDDDRKSRLHDETSRITDQIHKYKERNWTKKFLKERFYPEKLRCLLKAVFAAPGEIARLENELDASQIKEAIDWYREQPEGPIEGSGDDDDDTNKNKTYVKEYEQRTLSEFDSPQAIGAYLKRFDNVNETQEENHKHVTVNEGKYNTYDLEYRSSGIERIDVTSPEDIFEFPCMKKVDKCLKEGVPNRWILFTLARYILSLENDFGVDGVHEVFSRYPWYDQDVTEREAKYEQKQDYLPIGCNATNKKFTEFCIGRDECDYSLYYSARHKDEVYEALDDQ